MGGATSQIASETLEVPGGIPPYGGRLVDRTVSGREAETLRKEAADLPRVPLSARTLSDLYLVVGTKVREMLARGERPPAEFTRAEVADILMRAYAASGDAASGKATEETG